MNKTTLALVALLTTTTALLIAAEPTNAMPGDIVYARADTNQDCIIQYGEYVHIRHDLLTNQYDTEFKDYAFARAALIYQDPARGYDALRPEEYQCDP
jgi:hypothetical protein